MATLLDICKAVAINVGIAQPDSVIGNTDLNQLRLGQFVNETGEELARRFDWSGLIKEFDFAGTSLPATVYDLPTDFIRLIPGNAVHNVDGPPIRGGLSHSEWAALQALVASAPASGQGRYFDLKGRKIAFYPALSSAVTVRVIYVSGQWVTGGKTACDEDSDVPLVPETLLRMGAIYRWRRHVGNSFADQMAEYEAALQTLSTEDARHRTGV